MLKHHLAICGHSWMVDGGVSCEVTRLNHPPENSGSPYFSMNAACQLQADAYRRPTFSPRIGTPRTLRCWPWACTMAPSWSTTCARGRRSPSIRAPSEPTSTRIQCGRLHCHALDPTGPDNECWLMVIITSSTAQGGGGSFKNKKPIGEVGCCESGMAARSHCWIERCLISLTLSLSFPDYLPTYLSIFYVSIYLSI